MRRFLLLILVFSAVAIYFGYLAPVREGLQTGELAPDFSLPNQTGQMVRLSDFRGQIILLNFWATWCPPCVWEMPSMDRLQAALAPEGLKVIAVNLDEEGWETITAFLQKVPLSFLILADQNTDVAGSYRAFRLPQSYLIDPTGVIIKKYLGPYEWDSDEIMAEMRGLMGES